MYIGQHQNLLCDKIVFCFQAYKKKIGFEGTLLIEPKAKEPTRHQYDFDAQTVMSFLHQYNLLTEFKLNIEPNHTMLAGHPYEHDVILASRYTLSHLLSKFFL